MIQKKILNRNIPTTDTTKQTSYILLLEIDLNASKLKLTPETIPITIAINIAIIVIISIIFLSYLFLSSETLLVNLA